jgi:hypothetical protein
MNSTPASCTVSINIYFLKGHGYKVIFTIRAAWLDWDRYINSGHIDDLYR